MPNTRRFCHACNESHPANVERCPDCDELLSWLDAMPTPPSPHSGKAAVPYKEDSPPNDGAPLAGRRLGVYDVVSFAGRGGMATVYKAHHRMLQRDVALKVLREDLALEQPGAVDLFLSEARAAASLVHPNVVTVHNIVEESGLHLIELEWVDGPTLGNVLLERKRFDAAEAAAVMAQVAAGLEAAHSSGIIHRDLKPSNVLVSSSSTAKIADFGLARRLMAPEVLVPGLAGTPYFMAPELFLGGEATPHSDLYAAGVSLYLLLTGSFPFRAPQLRTLAQLHRESPIPDPRERHEHLPDSLVWIVNRCLAKASHDRYGEARELQDDLEQLIRILRPLDEMVEQALTGVDANVIQKTSAAIVVDVRLAKGRRQKVLVEEISSAIDDEQLIRIASPCAPVDESYLRRALELNSEVYHGALAIEDWEGRPYFVMRNAYPRATCDPEELRGSISTVAAAADEIEELLVGRDVH